ncbi:MAG: CRISPR-associated endonuclease Cas3'', partial [Deinococcus sp.]|nr:CRISPR-associated endonuclease Cas3'' [Deinococcus sp.]
MTLLALPAVTQITASLWAKSPRQTGEVKLGVLEHLLNVAACAAEILDLEPPQVGTQMAADLGLSREQGLAWVLALIALHDLGKASPAFQVLWPGGKAEVDAR